MADIAVLALKVDASDVTRAAQELQKLTQAGAKTEAQATSLGRATLSMGQAAATSASASVGSFQAVQRAQVEATRAATANTKAQVDAARAAEVNAQRVSGLGFAWAAAARQQAAAQQQASRTTTSYAGVVQGLARAQQASIAAAQGASASQVAVGRSGIAAAEGLKRLNEPLRLLTQQATGVSPAVARIVDVLGSLAVGSTVMVGVLAGLTAVSVAYNKLSEDARKAKERTQEAIDALRKLGEERRQAELGPAGVVTEQTGTVSAAAGKLQREIADLQGQLTANFDAEASAFLRSRLIAAQKEYDALVPVIRSGEEQLAEIRRATRREELEEQAARQRQVREGLAVEARIREEAFAKLQRTIDPKPFTDVARGLQEIARVEEQIKQLQFSESFETGEKAAKEMREEIERLTTRLEVLKASVPENVRNALGAPIPVRQADFLGAAASNLGTHRITPRDPGANEAEDVRRRAQQQQEFEQGFERAHRNGIARGFEAARGAVEKMIASAFSPENIGAGIAQSIGQRLFSAASNLVGELSGENRRARDEVTLQNTIALERVAASITEFGNKIRDLSAQDIGRFNAFAAQQQQFRVDESGPALTGRAAQTAQDLAEFFGLAEAFGDSIDPAEWRQLVDLYNQAAEAARNLAQAERARLNERRELALAGDTQGLAAFDAGAAREDAIRRAQDEFNRGLITEAQFLEDAALAQREYEKAIQDSARAAEDAAAAEAERKRQFDTEKNRFTNNILADIARLNGDEAAAKTIERADILFDAIARFGEDIRPTIEAWFAAQDAHEAEAKAAQEAAEATQRAADVMRDMAQAAREIQAMRDDYNVRNLRVSGDERGAFIAEQSNRGRDELAGIEQRLRQQGLSGTDLQFELARWAQLIAREFAKNLAEFDARAAASASEAALPPQGDRSRDSLFIDPKSIEAMKFATVSDSTAVELRIIERSQLAVLRSIEANTRAMSRGTFGVPTPDFSGGIVPVAAPSGGTRISVTVGNIYLDGERTDDASIRGAVEEAVVGAVDKTLGPRFGRAERNAGKTEL